MATPSPGPARGLRRALRALPAWGARAPTAADGGLDQHTPGVRRPAHGAGRLYAFVKGDAMPTTSALVIGGSLASMCAARVLSDVVDRVTIIERDAYPSAPDFRPG